MKMPHANHQPHCIGPVSAPGLGLDTLPLVSAEKEGILLHGWECHLSASNSYIPAARGGDEGHSGSSVAVHLWDGSAEGLLMGSSD